jgi:hypothetical protein
MMPMVASTAVRDKFLMGVPYVVGMHSYQRLAALDRSACLLCGATDTDVRHQASTAKAPATAGMASNCEHCRQRTCSVTAQL